MNRQVKLALVGAGNRGQGIFGQYALDMPHRAKFVAVAEPDKDKRELFARKHGIPSAQCFDSMEAFYAGADKSIEGAIIATLEDQREKPLAEAMKKGWNVLMEKPLCKNAQDLIRICDSTKDYKGVVIVCHQMRLTPIYKTIKSLVDSGDYGKIVAIQHSENLAYSHMAHSFVRGFFNSSKLSPMLLAKSCHDMDILAYLIGRPAKKVASFGSLKYFKKEPLI